MVPGRRSAQARKGAGQIWTVGLALEGKVAAICRRPGSDRLGNLDMHTSVPGCAKVHAHIYPLCT